MSKLPKEKVWELLKTTSPKYSALLALGVATGGRITELVAVQREDLLNPDGTLKSVLRLNKLKSKKTHTREVYIPAEFRPYIKKMLDIGYYHGYMRKTDYVFRGHGNKPLSRYTAYIRLKKEFRRVGLIGKYATHSMRKTYADSVFSELSSVTDPMSALEETRKALGHDRIDNTVKYLGLHEANVEKAQENYWSKN